MWASMRVKSGGAGAEQMELLVIGTFTEKGVATLILWGQNPPKPPIRGDNFNFMVGNPQIPLSCKDKVQVIVKEILKPK